MYFGCSNRMHFMLEHDIKIFFLTVQMSNCSPAKFNLQHAYKHRSPENKKLSSWIVKQILTMCFPPCFNAQKHGHMASSYQMIVTHINHHKSYKGKTVHRISKIEQPVIGIMMQQKMTWQNENKKHEINNFFHKNKED